MAKIELRPCPFCGGTDIEMEDNAYMRCTSCGASSGWKDSPVEAINAWNSRARENDSDGIMQKTPVECIFWRDSETEWGAAANLGELGCTVAKGTSAMDATRRLMEKLEAKQNEQG